MTAWNIALIFLLIGLNGFFVAVEFGAVTSRRARLDVIAGEDHHAARIVRRWLDDTSARDRLIAASQLGITVVSLALGAVGENTFEAWLEPYFYEASLPASLAFLQTILPALPLAFSLIIVTSLHVVLGEQVPKVAALRSPERFSLFAAPFMQVFSTVFYWFVALLDWATRTILALVGLPPASPHSSVYSLEEIREIMAGPEVQGVIEQNEREMLTAIIDFGELVVRQVAVPRTEIVAIKAELPLRQVVDLVGDTTLTKFPVYEDDLDQILGILHIRDLLKAITEPANLENPARSLVREAIFVPETISVNDLLRQFRDRHQHIAIVLDEFGGTAGLVTLEDLMEEIVGEVSNPFEAGSPAIQPLEDGKALVDGLALIEEINEHFGLHLYDPNYDTIAGFLLGKLERIPQIGDTVHDPQAGIRLTVESMDRLRIARLILEKE